MTLDLWSEKGVPLERQSFDWRELVEAPYSKLDDDAFTRVRVLMLGALEAGSARFQGMCGCMNAAYQRELAAVRRVEHHQRTLLANLCPADQSPLETAIGFAQASIEVIASMAIAEPDVELQNVYRSALLENLDQLYRSAALYDRLEGKDPNTLIQSYTDILQGRASAGVHRAPHEDLHAPYDRATASPASKLHASIAAGLAEQKRDFLLSTSATFGDPLARQLFAELSSIDEQQAIGFASLADPRETWLEKWLLHEACEVYGYFSAASSETNARLRTWWEKFTDFELGQFHLVKELFERVENRDAAEVIAHVLPEPIRFESHRSYVRQILRDEPENHTTSAYRRRMNEQGSPSETIAAGYVWTPGGELQRPRPRSETVGRI